MSPHFLFRENIKNDTFLFSIFSLFLKIFSKFKTNTFSNTFSVFTKNENKKWTNQTPLIIVPKTPFNKI